MKKLLLITVISVLGALTFSLSAQSIEGEWISESIELEEGMTSNLNLALYQDNTGGLSLLMLGDINQEGINIKLEFLLGFPLSWTINDNLLQLDLNQEAFYYEVLTFELSTGDPAMDAVLAEYKDDILDSMLSEIVPEVNGDSPFFATEMQILSLTEQELVLEIDGEGLTFYHPNVQ